MKTLQSHLQWAISQDQPDIRTVNPDATHFHGTRADPFISPNPGTCFTTSPQIALHFAQHGSYYSHKPQQGAPRVLTAFMDLPDGALFVPAAPILHEYLRNIRQSPIGSNYEAEQNAIAEREIRSEYHQEAQLLCQEAGLDAYYADLFDNPNHDALVVMNSYAVRITKHDVRSRLQERAERLEHAEYALPQAA